MITDKDLLKQSQKELYWNKGFKEGFQKGKLEAFSEVRKIMGEEVREYDENMEAYSFRVLKRIKQLQKEIGGKGE